MKNRFKEILKVVPGVRILLKKRNVHKAVRTIIGNARNYESAFLKNSTSYPEKADALYYRRELIIGAHILETPYYPSVAAPGNVQIFNP